MFLQPLYLPPVFKPRDERLRTQAKLLRLSLEARRRLEWMLHHELSGNASLTCRRFGIARRIFHKWKKRFREQDLSSLEDQSRRPKNMRRSARTPIQTESIIALRTELIRVGAKKLSLIHQARSGEKLSAYHFEKVIQQKQLYYHPARNTRLQAKRRKNRRKKCRIGNVVIKQKVFHIFEFDSIVIHLGTLKFYIVTAIDRMSRVALARVYPTHASYAAADFLRRLVVLVGSNKFLALTDNGSEFHRDFMTAIEEMKMTQIWARPYTPKDKPQVERFNRTLQEEFLDGKKHLPLPELNRQLSSWLVHYNFERPHCSLQYLPPLPWIAKFYPKVLPMYPVHT